MFSSGSICVRGRAYCPRLPGLAPRRSLLLPPLRRLHRPVHHHRLRRRVLRLLRRRARALRQFLFDGAGPVARRRSDQQIDVLLLEDLLVHRAADHCRDRASREYNPRRAPYRRRETRAGAGFEAAAVHAAEVLVEGGDLGRRRRRAAAKAGRLRANLSSAYSARPSRPRRRERRRRRDDRRTAPAMPMTELRYRRADAGGVIRARVCRGYRYPGGRSPRSVAAASLRLRRCARWVRNDRATRQRGRCRADSPGRKWA